MRWAGGFRSSSSAVLATLIMLAGLLVGISAQVWSARFRMPMADHKTKCHESGDACPSHCFERDGSSQSMLRANRPPLASDMSINASSSVPRLGGFFALEQSDACSAPDRAVVDKGRLSFESYPNSTSSASEGSHEGASHLSPPARPIMFDRDSLTIREFSGSLAMVISDQLFPERMLTVNMRNEVGGCLIRVESGAVYLNGRPLLPGQTSMLEHGSQLTWVGQSGLRLSPRAHHGASATNG